MAATGVFTRDKRITFVKGWLTGGTDPADGSVECGDRTAFSLKVTLEQMFEILYRVKDATFSGSLLNVYGFSGISLNFSAAAMPTDYFSGTTSDVVIERSYADTDGPPQNLTTEREIWTANKSSPFPDAASTILRLDFTHGIVTGLTHYAETFVLPATGYYPYGDVFGTKSIAAVEVAFGNSVAVTGDGSPLNPANEIWMQFGFQAYTPDTPITPTINVSVFTESTGLAPEEDAGVLTIELATGTLTCQLISEFGTYADGSSSLTLTATEWWPYAKLVAGASSPVWNSLTGDLL